ncbi:FAD-dependent monooxygenase [Metabacillus fastidiosus]|uniref:FAD-dependent monooxygenase n=1 Tax=Metabacillus fastidiosus TaxID=1458 RepID=UPI003D27A7C7
MKQKAIIVGGGIAGLCAGIMLQQKGLEVEIFDKNMEPTVAGAGIIIAPNALEALKPYGIVDEIILQGNPSDGFCILSQRGKLLSKLQIPARFDKMYSLHRKDLHQILLSQLRSDTVHFAKDFQHIEQNNGEVKVTFRDGSVAEGDFLVAADGIHSSIRKQLLNKNLYRYAGYTCWRGIVSARSIPNVITDFSETWAANGRFGLVPLPNNQLYWYALINAEERDPRFAKYTPQDLAKHFIDYHEPAAMIINNTRPEQMIHRDIVDIQPMEQFFIGRTIFIGDAAHAITPNMGQGACQAIEDANILAECIKRNKRVEQAFKQYNAHRQKRIQDLSKQCWQLGKVAQYEKGAAVVLRNILLKSLPASMMRKQAQPIYEFPNL